MKYSSVDIVNEFDEVMGSTMLAQVWKYAYIHRGVFILVRDASGRILLQKRSADMSLFPDCWDISAGSHVDTGQTYLEAARIQVEEIGLNPDGLHENGKYYFDSIFPDGKRAKRFVMLYEIIAHETPFKSGEGEACTFRWFTLAKFDELMETTPELVTDALRCAHLVMQGNTPRLPAEK